MGPRTENDAVAEGLVKKAQGWSATSCNFVQLRPLAYYSLCRRERMAFLSLRWAVMVAPERVKYAKLW